MRFTRSLSFFKTSSVYAKRGMKGIAFDSWALFLERALGLIAKNGTLAIILPSGIVANEGTTLLRKSILQKRIRAFYEFENNKGIFAAIDRRYKFLLLVADDINSSEDFRAAFYLRNVESLKGETEKEKFVSLSKDFIRLVSPTTYSIPEIRTPMDIRICEELYKRHPLLGNGCDGWTFTIMRELHKTESAKLFRTNGKGWPLIEGKNFGQFIPDYEKQSFTIESRGRIETDREN